MHIPISSVIVQNPPDLLPTRSIWPLSICPGCRCHSQPLPGVSRKQRYNTLDFPTENRVPTGVLLAPIGNPEPKGLCPSGLPARPCGGYPFCSRTLDMLLAEQVKQSQRFARVAGRSDLCDCFCSTAAGQSTHGTLGLSWRFLYQNAKSCCCKFLYLV